MIRSNTKKAADGVRAYVLMTAETDGGEMFRTFTEAAEAMNEDFICRAYSTAAERRQNRQAAFIDYARTLPSSVFDYYVYYHTDPIALVGNILEETDEERARFSDDEAADFMTKLIYREMMRALSAR